MKKLISIGAFTALIMAAVMLGSIEPTSAYNRASYAQKAATRSISAGQLQTHVYPYVYTRRRRPIIRANRSARYRVVVPKRSQLRNVR